MKMAAEKSWGRRLVVVGRTIAALFWFVSNGQAFCPEGSISCCNNVDGLCEFPVDSIMYGMVHNAMSSPSHGFILFANHANDPIVESLDSGYRGLSLDLCNCRGGKLTFCHGGSQVGCGVGSRDPVETFLQINEWIDDNPNNVVMIWLQINEEAGGPISLEDVDNIVQSVPTATDGISFADRLYKRDRYESAEWPTLQELVDMEQQVLFFYMGGTDGAVEAPPGIHYFYEYGFSTPWSYASVQQLRDSYVDGCPIDRGSSNRNDFFMMNAFVTAKFFGIQVEPKQSAANQINTATFLEPLVEQCESSVGQTANIVSVDFWDSGDMASFVNAHNARLVSRSGTTKNQTSSLSPSNSPSENVSAPVTSQTGGGTGRSGTRRKRIKDSFFGG